MSAPRTVAVLGGGISGLSLAYFLRCLPNAPRVVLVEATGRLGGWIKTEEREGFLLEQGPRSFRPAGNGIETLRLIEELNLQSASVVAPSHTSRILLHRGTLQPLPSSLYAAARSPLSPLLLRGVLHELRAPPKHTEDESIFDFFARRFSPDVARYLVDPVVAGIYAGDIQKLSVRSCFPTLFHAEQQHGSVILGTLREKFALGRGRGGGGEGKDKARDGSVSHSHSEFVRTAAQGLSVGFRGGMETLTKKLTDALEADPQVEIYKTFKVEKIIEHTNTELKGDDGTLTLSLASATPNEPSSIENISAVFSTLPAMPLAQILRHSILRPKESSVGLDGGAQENQPCKDAAEILESIQYSSVAAVNVCYAEDVLPLSGFGFLVPSIESPSHRGVLGTIFDSSVFPEQARGGGQGTRFTVMLGGAHNPIDSRSRSEVEDASLKVVHELLGVRAEPALMNTRFCMNSIAQYEVGHWKKLRELEECMQKVSGSNLWLLGTWKNGAGVADCVFHAKMTAKKYAEAVQ